MNYAPYSPAAIGGYVPSMGGYAPSAMGYAPPAYPMSTVGRWDIVGADATPTAPPDEGIVAKTKTFLGKETVGIKNGYLLAGAVALGTIYYGSTKGWFGGRKAARR